MSLPIRIKLERALVRYLKSKAVAGTRLASISIVAGHTATEPELPYLVVYVGAAPPHPDLPAETGVRLCKPVFHLKTSASDEERAKADDRFEELDTFLMEPMNDNVGYSDENKAGGRLLAALNKPASGGDSRPVELRKFHAYDFTPADDQGAHQGAAWHDQRAFDCPCQPFDSH
jgi:hypothetical protein